MKGTVTAERREKRTGKTKWGGDRKGGAEQGRNTERGGGDEGRERKRQYIFYLWVHSPKDLLMPRAGTEAKAQELHLGLELNWKPGLEATVIWNISINKW